MYLDFLQMVRRKSKAPSAKSVEVLPENLGIDDIQALLKHRLGQLQLPPEIFGFSEERRYFILIFGL